jgi:cation:H+ antiporter
MGPWLTFVASTAAILYCGVGLSRYGDVIAAKTGLGGTWIGVVLMASVTSLPELVTGLSAVTYVDAPNIAAGDAFGSCVFNIFVFSLLDLSHRRGRLLAHAHEGHSVAAGFGILLISLACLAIAAEGSVPAIGWVGVPSFLFLAIYLAAMKVIFVYERDRSALSAGKVLEAAGEPRAAGRMPLRRAVLLFALNAGVVVAAAIALPKTAKDIAGITGLGRTFVGTALVAAATSLPEVVVSFAAVRIGAVDLAAGNLFGSNVFNIGILAIDDLFYVRGPLFSAVDSSHVITGLAAIAMTGLAMVGLTLRSRKKPWVLSWETAGIAAIYVATLAILKARSSAGSE